MDPLKYERVWMFNRMHSVREHKCLWKAPTIESRYSRLFLGHRHTQFGMNQTFHYDLSSGVASLILQYFNFWHRSKYLSAESLFAVKYSPLRIHRIQRPETAGKTLLCFLLPAVGASHSFGDSTALWKLSVEQVMLMSTITYFNTQLHTKEDQGGITKNNSRLGLLELRVTTQYNYFIVLSKQACNFKITKHLLFDLDDTQSLIYAFL